MNAEGFNKMDALRICVLSLLLVAVAASPHEDGKRTPGRFYISLSDIPILGSLFTHQTGNGTASNKTTTLKHLQFYPILPSLIPTSEEQLNASDADANGKANCNQHNNHIHPQSGPYMGGTQKGTTAAQILDSKFQSKPAQVKPSDGATPNLPPQHNTVIPAPVGGQNHPGLMFQNPFPPTKKPYDPNASQDQGISSTTAAEDSSAISSQKPGIFEFFHPTEASQTTSTTKHPIDNYWSESFGIPSHPIKPGYAKPPATSQKPHIPTQQIPVNAPNYPFFPFGQWTGAIPMPGAFGIPEGTVDLPNGIFQYPPQFVQTQLPTSEVQGHNEPFANIWPTKQPQNSQLQNGDLNSNKEVEQPQPTGAPQASQQTGTSQDHQIHHIYQPVYGQHNWHQGLPYVPYTPQIPGLTANSQGSMQVLAETLQQNSAGSFQHMPPTQEQETVSHPSPQLQRFPQNYKSIYAPMPLMLQRI